MREKSIEYLDTVPVPKLDAAWNEKLDYYAKARHKGNRNLVRMMASFLRFCAIKSGRVLEVGCGSGWLRHYMPGVNYVGLEVLLMKDVKMDFPLAVGLGEKLPFKDGAFDHVMIVATLDHVFDPAQIAAESFRVLKKGGTICLLNTVKMPSGLRKLFVYGFLLMQKIAFFDYESIGRNMRKAVLHKDDDYHTFEFSANEMTDLLVKAGCEKVESRDFLNTSFVKGRKPAA